MCVFWCLILSFGSRDLMSISKPVDIKCVPEAGGLLIVRMCFKYVNSYFVLFKKHYYTIYDLARHILLISIFLLLMLYPYLNYK